MSASESNFAALENICDRLAERTATLFLGAGINAGIRNDAGVLFPLGQSLGQMICDEFLKDTYNQTSLAEVAEIAKYKVGERALNEYLYGLFSTFKPGIAQLALVQLPWDIIYTTNYDLLVEQAATSPSVQAAGHIVPVFRSTRSVVDLTETDIPYYKLHGSIEEANTEEGRLILTRDDYRFYDRSRKQLFQRLKRDLVRRTFVFIGYSLIDDDFRNILEDCFKSLDISSLPLSYAIMYNFSNVQEAYWRDKYNVQLIKADAAEFLNEIRETWNLQNRAVLPLDKRRAAEFLQVDESTRFPKIGDTFYQIIPTECTGQSFPQRFFKGGEPLWSDIRDGVPPQRDHFEALAEAIFDEIADPSLSPSLYLITGSAGTGKTTLARSLAFYLAKEFGSPVLAHVPDAPLDVRAILPLLSAEEPRRIIILIDHAAECLSALENFMSDAKQRSLPISVIIEERRNQWNYTHSTIHSRLSPEEIELGTLSRSEIEKILNALEKYDALGKLTGTSLDYQIDHFTALADKELLVALRELTTGTSFDHIIKDEYNKIPSDAAKQAYTYVAAVGQFDLAIRYETLLHILDISWSDLRPLVFAPAEGVLLSSEDAGISRHNEGFRLRARHPVIASVVFDTVASNDETRFTIFNTIFTQLDAGYAEDYRLLGQISRRREIIDIFSSPEVRRAIYERLEVLLPDDPYVLQHRSIVERELNNPDAAVRYAREALKRQPKNAAFANTLGLALEFSARFASDPLRFRSLISEASRLFDEGVRQNPNDPYGYIGRYYVLKQKIEKETDAQDKILLRAQALSQLEEAYEATEESEKIASHLAELRKQLGQSGEANNLLRIALERKPSDNRVRDLLVRYEIKGGNFGEALLIAQEGVKFDPTSWRLQRHIARIMEQQKAAASAVGGHYQAAIRHHRGDIDLLVEYASFLFRHGEQSEAMTAFNNAVTLPIASKEKNKLRHYWKFANGKECIFTGKVKALRGAKGIVLAIPENFEATFQRSYEKDIREGSQIQFRVAFNAWGAVARVEHNNIRP